MPARSGIVAIAAVFAVALLGVGIANQRAVKDASSTLVRGQADLLHDQLRLALGRGDITSEDLDDIRSAYADADLRYIALGDASGGVRASSGTSAWPSIDVGGRGLQLERVGGLARATYRRGLPPRLARRVGASVSTLLVFEFEPRSINDLERRASWGIGVSALFGLFAIALALSYARQVRRAEASQRAEEQSRRLAALGQMSAVLAHELRNPLASLKGHAQLLERGLEGAQRDKAHLVVGEAVRLEKLSNDLLTFVRTGELHRAPTDLATIMPDGIDAPHVTLDIDAERMRQVIANLVDNARAAGEPVEVSIGDGEPVTITVRDHGAGIADPQRLFEPYYTTKTHGTGLGLAIAHKIVALHGGTLVAEDASPGARFTVSLPRRAS